MRSAPNIVRFVGFLSAVALAGACSPSKQTAAPVGGSPSTAVVVNAPGAQPGEVFPAPRWPSYFKPAKSVDELMPAARVLVRNQSGFQGKGMGILKAGDSVLIVVGTEGEPMVLEAVKRALEERQVKPHIKFGYELLGETREVTIARRDARRKGHDLTNAGIYQASQWLNGQFARPEEPKAWLKQRRPDVYDELFPEEKGGGAPAPRPAAAADAEGGPTGSDGQAVNIENAPPQGNNMMGDAIKKYLTAHPEIMGVFWGGGGTTGLRRQLYPMQDKYLGTFLQSNIYNLQSSMSSYPGDVWQLAEEQLMEPIIYADRVEIRDPEGTNIWADLTTDMAERWVQGSYQRGHLYMFPNQATGRFGYSFVNYPAFSAKWLAREPLTLAHGVVAGTQGHGGFYPRWEITYTDGYISDVKGGGVQGVALKEFLTYPKFTGLTYPYHNKPGYWYLYEVAFGSHPKGFRDPTVLLQSGATTPERARSGVIHWGLGARLWHDPDAPTESKKWAEFTKVNNVPYDHGFHTHTYFTTYKVRLRNANKYVTLLDKGRMTSLDNPEVRALASRYGDPNVLLAEDWIPEVPGINAPGDYMKDYAPNPGAYALKTMDKAMKGTYEHYYPEAGGKITYGEPVGAAKTGARTGGGG